jgi:hypothetical protein
MSQLCSYLAELLAHPDFIADFKGDISKFITNSHFDNSINCSCHFILERLKEYNKLKNRNDFKGDINDYKISFEESQKYNFKIRIYEIYELDERVDFYAPENENRRLDYIINLRNHKNFKGNIDDYINNYDAMREFYRLDSIDKLSNHPRFFGDINQFQTYDSAHSELRTLEEQDILLSNPDFEGEISHFTLWEAEKENRRLIVARKLKETVAFNQLLIKDYIVANIDGIKLNMESTVLKDHLDRLTTLMNDSRFIDLGLNIVNYQFKINECYKLLKDNDTKIKSQMKLEMMKKKLANSRQFKISGLNIDHITTFQEFNEAINFI